MRYSGCWGGRGKGEVGRGKGEGGRRGRGLETGRFNNK